MQLDSTILWIVMLGIGGGTFLIRFSFICLFGKKQMPEVLMRSLRLVPAAIFSALIVPSFALTQQATFSVGNYRMWAGIIAVGIAWKTRNVILTIVAGMAVLWFCTLVL